MQVYDIRDNEDDNKDNSFQIIFGSEGEFIKWDENENDVLWIIDEDLNNEVGIYNNDIDKLIRALEMFKEKLKEIP